MRHRSSVNRLSLVFALVVTVMMAAARPALGQDKVKVNFESIKEQCKDLPLDQRIRLTVARFNVTTGVTSPEFGGNLATMLSNALQEVNCYRVLESIHNSGDMKGEIEFGADGNTNGTSSPKKGKMLGAQVVVTGEITEFNVKSSGMRIGLVKTGSNTAHIGFVLKMVNPETREILFSKSINVDGKASGSTQVGVFGVNLVSSSTNNPAVANACEQGIIQAVEFLASKKDILGLPPAGAGMADAGGANETTVVVSNINFTAFTALAKSMNGISRVKSMEKSLVSGTATFKVMHAGAADDFLGDLTKVIGTKYEITGFDKGVIQMVAK